MFAPLLTLVDPAPFVVLVAALLSGCSRGANDDGRCPTTLAAGQKGPRAVTVDGTNVYWTNESDGTVMKVPVGGGPPTTLASGQNAPLALAVYAANVYWTNTGTGDANSSAIMRVPIGGGTPTAVASAESPVAIAVDGTSVYWAEIGGGRKRLLDDRPPRQQRHRRGGREAHAENRVGRSVWRRWPAARTGLRRQRHFFRHQWSAWQ